MSSNVKQTKIKSFKLQGRQQVSWLVSLTCFLILAIASWMWWENTNEIQNLSLIGLGQNVVVQIHDPG